MLLWLVFALMTAAAVLAVLWPLSRPAAAPRGGNDLAVYRDQLDEIARDRAAGLIGEAEAEAAKIEVSRRLIAAADAADAAGLPSPGAALRRRRVTAAAVLALLPLGAVALYLSLGSPELPGAPLAPRLAAMRANASIEELVARVEAHLEKNPSDARGYAVLVPVYLRLGRFGEAVDAERKVIALAGETAERQADLGEALTGAANGIVTTAAKSAFERALTLDPAQPKARFFLGVAAEQDGDRDKAAAIWRELLDTGPSDAPWAETVRQALARLGDPASDTAATDPSAADIAAAAGLSARERADMIRGMVARLAERLKRNGDDVAGWQRLLRAYVVLGERDEAQAAAAEARRALAADADKLRRIDDVIRSLGLGTP
ncbi:MAG: c-type cytochrome biogenesis protein CcmI [Pseudolabrys sp.]|nr:c-type cytochrome biogenesis protein CcmI [Pseudolabrys sp.]